MADKQPQEPMLAVDQIQGNVLLGFNKDFQALLFLKIVEVSGFRRWLETLISPIVRITTTADVLTFRSLLKKAEDKKQPNGPLSLKATWINIAFSYNALVKLGMITEQAKFKDQAFRQGLRARSESLGDPIDGDDSPQTWVVGGPDNEADVILIVASDDPADLSAEVKSIRGSVSNGGKTNQYGVWIIREQRGANLPGKREHFGFRDGVSQPGVRGRIPGNPNNFLTPRRNPNDPNQGKPGQDLLWPGEFVFGAQYPKQDPTDHQKAGKNSLDEADPAAPNWAENGSFLVFRRLRQDVEAFDKFLRYTARQLGLTPDHFGAMCVGRWKSGAPLLRALAAENGDLGGDECANNHFEFQKSSNPIPSNQKKKPDDCTDDQYASSQGDPTGEICPFAAHIRRTNPRDDMNKNEAQTHHLLRRGIPYDDNKNDRGLLFLAYQTSIEKQFEFVQKLANNPWFRAGNPGYDPIIGQNNRGNPRTFRITSKDGQAKPVDVALPNIGWVIPTGGGYFFAPSINALKMLAEAR